MTVISSLKQFVFLTTLCLFTPCYAKVFDLAILGDSISSGYGVGTKENWVNLMIDNLPCKIKYRNLSVQGATSSDGLTTLKEFYQSHSTKTLIIELGGNDALRGQSLTQLYKNLTQLVEIAQTNQSQVMIIGVDMPPNYGSFFRQRLKSTYEHVASTDNIASAYLDFPNNPALMQDDGIHPNKLGHQEIANNLTPDIQSLVCEKSRS